jgi:hypothetical protein
VHEASRIVVYHWHPPPTIEMAGSTARPAAASPRRQPTSTTSAKLPYPPPHQPLNYIPYNQPPLPPHNQYIPPPPQFGTADPKSPLANHLQLAPCPMHYRATTPPKYHRNADPHKLLMSYEVIISLAKGDKATLAKTLIISIEDAAANWYSRLPPGCIYSWP